MLRPPSSSPALLAILLCAIAGAACGHKIGDSCSVSSDCASDGTRVCDTFSPGGSCTIKGCDYGTCPDEAVCVRFFPALRTGTPCTGPADCLPDEVCTVGDNASEMQCAPRAIEQRFCMLTCDGNGDCREGYECRDEDLMRRHGGEPVPNPANNEPVNTRFCASRRTCANQSECEAGEVCDLDTRVCLPSS
jgi:hypothetical protein